MQELHSEVDASESDGSDEEMVADLAQRRASLLCASSPVSSQVFHGKRAEPCHTSNVFVPFASGSSGHEVGVS